MYKSCLMEAFNLFLYNNLSPWCLIQRARAAMVATICFHSVILRSQNKHFMVMLKQGSFSHDNSF